MTKEISFPLMCSNIPAAPTYGEFISQLMQYSRAFVSCQRVAASNEASEFTPGF
jgi:hypothetical protein